jgi:hypothetical protein
VLAFAFQFHKCPDRQLVQADRDPSPAQHRAVLGVAEDREKAQGLENPAQGRAVADFGLEFPPDLEPPGFFRGSLEGQNRFFPGLAQPQGPAIRAQTAAPEIVEGIVFPVPLADDHGAHFEKLSPDPAEIGRADLDLDLQH